MKKLKHQLTQPKTIRIHPRLLILCEGQTEEIYFESLKLEFRHTGVEIPRTRINTPKQLVAEAVYRKKQALKERNPFDSIYVVFDYDPQATVNEAFDMADRHNIRIVYSNPCFELWFLLHFIGFSTAAYTSCDQVVHALKKFIPEYRKGQDYGHILIGCLDKAVKNAVGLMNHWESVGNGKIQTYNPYCDIKRLIDEIRFE